MSAACFLCVGVRPSAGFQLPESMLEGIQPDACSRGRPQQVLLPKFEPLDSIRHPKLKFTKRRLPFGHSEWGALSKIMEFIQFDSALDSIRFDSIADGAHK